MASVHTCVKLVQDYSLQLVSSVHMEVRFDLNLITMSDASIYDFGG